MPYYDHLDPEFGLMYVRLETWFPHTVQVYVNGDDWLAGTADAENGEAARTISA